MLVPHFNLLSLLFTHIPVVCLHLASFDAVRVLLLITASVHPCQHSAAMLKIVGSLTACDVVPSVDQYIFIFLKFIQSVVPTIEYDYTMEVQVGGGDHGRAAAADEGESVK